jgi:DNA-binding transcriptional ArsR family regulator
MERREEVLEYKLSAFRVTSPPPLSTAPPTIELLASPLGPTSVDSFERVLWWLFAGSAGATTRAQVLQAIREQPRNAQQLSEFLSLDYTTVRHHLRVLETNRLVLTEGDKYGRVYFISDLMESHWDKLDNILKRAGRERRSGGR